MDERKNIKRLTLYTGSNGKKGCNCNCLGCSQEAYGSGTPYYQASKQDIIRLLTLLPNIQDCIILGNPDPSVDPEFCNWVAKYMINKGIRIRMSSSGLDALNVAKILFKDVNTDFVDYMSYSIDSINEKTLWRLKGRKILLSPINDAIDYCKSIGIRVKIQPTIWEINKTDYKELLPYYINKGVKWFSFHVGSLEGFTHTKNTIDHISPDEWIHIREDLKKLCAKYDVSLHLPYLFMNEHDFKQYKLLRGEKCQPHSLLNTQVWIEPNKYRTTHCPLLREVRNFEYDLIEMDKSKIDYSCSEKGYCPATSACLGVKNCKNSIDGNGNMFNINGEIYHTICRSYNFNYNRPFLY